MTFLKLHSIRKSYGPVVALDGIDLAVEAGRRTAIVGPSGCGKTTLLRLIAGFDVPDSGTIRLGSDMIFDDSHRVPAHRRNIGIVAQDGCLFPHLSVADNIGFGIQAERAVRHERAAELMDMVGLDRAMLSRKPDQLSGGQQQRVALARALARKPRLMLLDEPFSALDTGLRVATRKAVTEVLSAAAIPTILVTHDQAEAFAFAEQLVVMQSGAFAQVGSPLELYSRPVDPATATFLGEAIILPADVSDGYADSKLGRLPVDDHKYRGSAQIMIRPEQIVVEKIGNGNQPSGTISDISFSGPVFTARITLHNGGSSFNVNIPSHAPFHCGDVVSIAVLGAAHLFNSNDRQYSGREDTPD
jgi:iron(III) transport system ATP-binding protein